MVAHQRHRKECFRMVTFFKVRVFIFIFFFKILFAILNFSVKKFIK